MLSFRVKFVHTDRRMDRCMDRQTTVKQYFSPPPHKKRGHKKVTQKLKFNLGRAENIVGKGENAGYQHFLLFP